MAAFKLGICKFALVSEVFFCFILLSAVVLGTLPFWSALLYGIGSAYIAGWVCRLFLPRARHAAAPASGKRRSAPALQVVAGGRAA